MRFDKLTSKFQQALADAQSLAIGQDNQMIEPQHLRNDDFDAFFQARGKALAQLIAEAMDKPVVEESGSNEPELESAVADVDTEVLEAVD